MKKYQIYIWLGALVVGIGVGLLGISSVNSVMNVIALVFTRLFRLLAVPTIVLAVVITLASIGSGKELGRMFRITLTYTLLTTFAAALVALAYYLIISPGNLPANVVGAEMASGDATQITYTDHLLSVVPDNMLKPLLDGNVLALLLLCFAIGIAISRMPDSKPKQVVIDFLVGAQDILHTLIRWLIAVLPIGIVAFAAQLVSEIGAGMMLDSLGKYVGVILASNFTQILIVIPLFLLASRVNPIKTMSQMMPAVIMAFFTKSSAATLPVTMESAENRAGVDRKVSRFVLPLCTTINMNGCAAFILATSMFIMQNNGMPISIGTMIIWVFVSVFAAFGNAGVPMGCYFLTLSLMSGIGADVSIMGVILPIYTIIDMIETAENVWSDSSVSVIVNQKFKAAKKIAS